MSNTFSKSSVYVDSLVGFTLDTKPYHTKLTEVAVEYRFEDTINVSIVEAVANQMAKKAGWLYSYFSGGDVNNRTMDLKRMVLPNVLRGERNNDASNNLGGFKVGRDENTDLANGALPYVYDKRNTAGIADVWFERGGVSPEYLVRSNDVFHNYGSMEFRVSPASPTDQDQSPRWQETRSETVMAEVNAATKYLANKPLNEALPWSIANSDPNSANYRIRQILNAIQAQLLVQPSYESSENLNQLFATLNTPDLPQSYEALWASLESHNITPINNPDTGLPFAGWRGEDGAPLAASKYVDDYISKNTPPAYFEKLSDLRMRESGSGVYDDHIFEGFSISSIQLVEGVAPDAWTATVSAVSPIVLEISGQNTGYIGAVVVGNQFTSSFISFNTAVAPGTVAVDDTFTFMPDSRLVIDQNAPYEVWNIIKTDPLAHNRPTFSSSRYGRIRSLSNVFGEVTVLDSTLPTGTVILTALSSTTFSLSSSAEPGYTGTVTVGTVFNDGRLGFTLVAGTSQTFVAGDRFYINIINEPAKADEFDLYYGYDLDSYDNQTRVYDNQNVLDPLYNVPLDFRFDSRFTDFNLAAMNLQLTQNAVSGRKYRLTANADGAPVNVIQTNGSGPNNIVNLAEPGGGTSQVTSMPGDANPNPDISVFYANSFKFERSTDGGNTWTTIAASIPVGSTYTNATEGVSFNLVSGSKPFIAVQTDSSITGGDIFRWTVLNEPPRVDPVPIVFSSVNAPRLIMHSDGFWEAPAANWTITFSSSSAYSINAVYSSGPLAGNSLSGYPITGNLDIPGSGAHRNLTFKNDHVHFTIVRGSRAFASGDQFKFTTYEQKPSFLVHGSYSGWQPEAEVGKWYWNGKIGFKVNQPVAQVFQGLQALVSGDADFPKISVTRVRPDTPELVYTFTRIVSDLGTRYTVNRSDVGIIGGIANNSTFKDAYVTIAVSDPASFQVSITPDQFQFWNAQDTLIVRPQIAGMMPTTNDFITIKKANYDRLGINLDYTNAPVIPDTTALNLISIDQNFINISTGSVPIETHSPEAVIFNRWIPLTIEGYDAVSSIAHFPDVATEVVVKSAASGETVGKIYSEGSMNEPINFEWDASFFNRYLKLNTASNLVVYNSFMNENVRVLMTERVNFMQGGGVLLEDAMFNDNVLVIMDEQTDWSINLDQKENILANIIDGPFGGFLSGYDNLPFDAENVTNLAATLGNTLIGTYSGDFAASDTFPQTVTLPFTTVPTGTTLITGPAALVTATTISITGPGRVTVVAYTAYTGAAANAGRYDTGAPIVDDFLRAQHLSSLAVLDPEQAEELTVLTSLINDYLQVGGITATTLVQFLAALQADIYASTAVAPTFGRPAVGAAIDTTKADTSTASTSISEAVTLVSVNSGLTFDGQGFDTDGYDQLPDKTAILLSLNNPPVPGGTIGGSYAGFFTPLYSPAAVRSIEVSFITAPVSTPTFQIWTPAMVSPMPVIAPEQLSPRKWRFSMAAESEVKVIVT